MKTITIYKRILLVLFLATVFSTINSSLFAQTCNQVEILYTSPDCLNEKNSADPGSGQNNGCKSIAVCKDQLYTYTSSITGTGWTYNWSVTGPTTISINPNNISSTVNIVWPQVGVYILTLTATDPSGNVFTYCLKVNVKDKPVANFTFTPNNVCAGSTISFTNTTTFGGGIGYSWNFGDPLSGSNNFSTSTNPIHTYNTAGNYTVTLIAYSFTTVSVPNPNGEPKIEIKTCCADTITKVVTIRPGSIKIECISTVCAGDTATYHAVGCANPIWLTPVGGSILSQAGDSVTIIWGNGNPQGQIQAQCPGGCIASVPVPIIPTNPVIVGNTSPCNSSTTSYSLPVLPGTFYTWTLLNISTATDYSYLINTYPDNNTVWINWALAPPGTYQLTINLENKHICCSSKGSLTIIPSDTWQVFIDQTICQGTAANLSVFPAAGTFNWTVIPPNTGVVPITGTGSTFNPVFSIAGTYTVEVIETANTYCNSGPTNPQQVKIKVINTPAPGTINGSTTACINSNYNYTMSSSAPAGYHYEWSITAGVGTFQPGNLATVNGNSASIQWTGLTGTISVVLAANGFPPCPSPAVTLNVIQATVGNITGTLNTCVDGAGSYTLTGGTLPPGEIVTWSLPAPFTSQGTIILGQGTNSITILWHGNTGAGPWGPITLNASTSCGNATALTGIMVYPKFTFTIVKTGTDVCSPGGITLTATGAPSGATYLWSPGGQTTPSITITTPPVSYPATYSVTATLGGCTFTKTYIVEDPFAIRPVTCGVGTCNGTATNEQLGVQIIKPLTGTFTYQWFTGLYPSGTLVPGATLPNYNAPADGNYYVVVTYGSCTRFLNFTVNKVCCPDINNPQITSVVRNSCNSFTFTGTTPNPTVASITWNFGNGVSLPGASGVPITYVYPPGTQPGDYCVTFCVGPPTPNSTNCTGNCVATTVKIPLLALFNYKLGCNGCIIIENLSVVLPTSGAATATYNWNFGDGSPVVSSSSATPPTHCYTATSPTIYTVTLTINYSDPSLGITCSSTDTKTFTYSPLAINVSPSPVCTGVQTTFSLVGSPSFSIISATWNFGDGFTAYTIPTTHIYNAAGTGIPVSLTVIDDLGNTCNANTTINVLPGIASCTILPGYICPGGSAILTAPNIAGAAYLWEVETTPGNFIPAPGTNNAMTYTTITPGFYHVIVTGSNGCICTSNKVEVKAVAKPKAIIAVSPSSKLCGPGNVFLSSSNHLNGYTSDWYANGNYGSLLSSGQAYFTFVPATTTFNLVLTNEYGCTDTCSLTVVVNPIPAQPVISSSPTLCEGVPISLTVTNYANNITWNTGSTTTSIVVYTAGIYTATYTDPVTGCSSSKNIKINRRPPTDLFPHFCEKIPCTCRDSSGNFTIYAPKPLIGAFAANYDIQWYFNNNPVGTNGNNPLFTPAVNGTYHIIVTDPVTGCKDTSDKYSVIVLPCDTCDCKNSKWGDIVLKEGPIPEAIDGGQKSNIIGNGVLLKCNKAQTLKCNQTYNINASFFCKDSTCPSKVTYTLQPPTGPLISGTAPFSFTTIPTSGVYVLTLYGWCGDKICDSCIIDLIVICDPECDCKGSKWGNIVLKPGEMPGANEMDQKAIIIDNGILLKCNKAQTLLCNQTYTINANYICKDSTCPSKVTYTLQPPTGPLITGTAPFTFTTIPTSGVYILTLYGWCGNKICDSCIIDLIVDCKKECDCKGSKWGEKTFTINEVKKPLNCMKPNDKPIDVKCNKPITINANYICNDPNNCPPKVTYKLQPPIGPSISGTAPFTFTPNQAGTYSVTLYGWCGNKICDSCVIRFKTDCPIETKCCKYEIKADTLPLKYDYTQIPNATVLTENFVISGLSTASVTEVRANVISYSITDNFGKDCMKCVNLPFTWASVSSATNIGTVSPQITMFGGATVSSFNGSGAGAYQNPREIVWNNNTIIPVPNNTNIGMSFILPPVPGIDCCELKGRICIKFTFRDKDCSECEVIKCFEFLIRKK